jgi:hypothetical protein
MKRPAPARVSLPPPVFAALPFPRISPNAYLPDVQNRPRFRYHVTVARPSDPLFPAPPSTMAAL